MAALCFGTSLYLPQTAKIQHARKSLEQLYNIKVEHNVSKGRLEKLAVSRWSIWRTAKCRLLWDWQVDQLVYVVEGEVRGCLKLTYGSMPLTKSFRWR
ncbi:hypothetical protein MKW92_030546 [Papaver armeniacum]|nr:hypothetical protein MKW92_030546 [Papaver armeniacum]